MSDKAIRIGKAELEAFTGSIFQKVGLSKEHADAWARMLVWANLRGTDFARHHPHPALHRSGQGEVDQCRAEHSR